MERERRSGEDGNTQKEPETRKERLGEEKRGNVRRGWWNEDLQALRRCKNGPLSSSLASS